jgi:hypothetical protein
VNLLAGALAYKACTAAKRVVFVSAPRMLNDLHGTSCTELSSGARATTARALALHAVKAKNRRRANGWAPGHR